MLAVVSILLLVGCATRFPGGDDRYNINVSYSKELLRMNARYDYGRFKGENLGSNGSISSFTEYHDLVVRWDSENGLRKEYRIAIGPLIEELKHREGNWFPTGWSEIQFRYEDPFLKIRLKIVSHGYPRKRYTYPLYRFEMR